MFTPEKEKRTVKTIYMHKLYDFLDNTTVMCLIIKIFYTIAGISLTLISAYPEAGIEYFKKFFLFENMLFPKAIVIFYIIFNIRTLLKYYYIVIGMTTRSIKSFTLKKRCKLEKKEDLIFGVPVYEILNHLFEEKHFKRDDIEKKFLIPRNKYQELAAKMEEINILKRGENNSRILNEDYTREQIARAFIFCEGDIKKMYMPVTQNGSSFTREPLSPALSNKYSRLDNINTTA